MANEPEREIEKLLKSAAKKRQDEAGTPPPLHPATRKMLQAEAARTHASKTENPGLGTVLFRSWPRFAIAFGAIVLLAWGGSLLFREEQPAGTQIQLAQNGNRNAELPKSDSLHEQSAVNAPEMSAAETKAPQGTFMMTGELKKSEAAEPARKLKGAAADADRARSRRDEEKDVSPLSQSYDSLSTAGVASPAPDDLARKGLDLNVTSNHFAALAASDSKTTQSNQSLEDFSGGGGGGAIALAYKLTSVPGQYYARVSSKDAGMLKTDGNGGASVLESFRVEQTGDQLRVIDKDGSVYLGFVGQTEAGASVSQDKRGNDQKETKLGVPAAPPSQYFFRVSGTNVSLKQEVLFSGHLIGPPAPPLVSASVAPASVAAGTRRLPASVFSIPLSNSTLNGRAVIGGTNAVEIIAKPAGPQ